MNAAFPETAPSSQSLSDGVFGKLVQRSAEQTSRGYSLHVGDKYLEPIELARAEAQLSETIPRLHNYAPVQGEPELLGAIVRKVQRRSGVTIAPHCLQVTAGATSAMGIHGTHYSGVPPTVDAVESGPSSTITGI